MFGRRYAYYVALALVILWPAGSASADWSEDIRQDSMTDEVISSALCASQSGFSLRLYRVSDGTIWATFRLPDASLDVLASRAPIFRIDKLEPVDIDGIRKTIAEMVEQEPKWVSWQVFHGGGAPNRGTLRDIMEGTTIVFRYFLFTGGYKETSFSLVGAKSAIASALQIPAEADSQTAAREAALLKIHSDAVEECRKNTDFNAMVKCVERCAECLVAAEGDPEKLRECLSR